MTCISVDFSLILIQKSGIGSSTTVLDLEDNSWTKIVALALVITSERSDVDLGRGLEDQFFVLEHAVLEPIHDGNICNGSYLMFGL